MPNIYLTNTLTHQKERFEPIDPANIGLYLCGPTVYDRPHIGNARSAVAFDVLHRFLKATYPKVTYVRNVTDVDDKINARALSLGCSIKELTTETLAQYHADIGALSTLPPDIEPRATDHIPHMIAMIETLIKRGHAYAAENHVLFDISSFSTYGALSRKKQDDLIAGARVEIAPYKKNAADFVLWKPSDDQTPGWNSPWGYGRPGWHIECSAMSATYLGQTFDIHAGGIDLVFPHHENEVAQSCCAHGSDKMANVWLHNGHLTVNGAKMSKSEGNFITVHDLLNAHDGEIIRLALMQSHYRQPLDWNNDLLAQSKSILDRYYGALARVKTIDDSTDELPPEIMEALSDDLNVPAALAILHDYANQLFKDENALKAPQIAQALQAGGHALGILLKTPAEWFQGKNTDDGLSEAEINALISERNIAKKARDFQRADAIRNELAEKGYTLLDSAEGTTWRKR